MRADSTSFSGVMKSSGHGLVFGELLMGDQGGRAKLLGAYALMRQASTVPHVEAVEFVRTRRLLGLGVGWIDVHILASALVGRFHVWTADPRLHAMAEQLRIAYRLAAESQ
jgi:hypothetical protein